MRSDRSRALAVDVRDDVDLRPRLCEATDGVAVQLPWEEFSSPQGPIRARPRRAPEWACPRRSVSAQAPGRGPGFLGPSDRHRPRAGRHLCRQARSAHRQQVPRAGPLSHWECWYHATPRPLQKFAKLGEGGCPRVALARELLIEGLLEPQPSVAGRRRGCFDADCYLRLVVCLDRGDPGRTRRLGLAEPVAW